MCGEKLMNVLRATILIGSSPHARGKALFIKVHIYYPRIIPACAGKSRRLIHPYRSRAGSSRMRGEKSCASRVTLLAKGSSPHARGKGPDDLRVHAVGRIIPACAGKRSRG